jgi:glycosyltransferase involved in cell wall biosynthesis
VTNCETTARKLHSLFGYDAAAVVKPGVSEHYRPRPAEEVEACLRLYGIKAPYIFTVVSRYEPRKNLGSLFEAFRGLKADGVLKDHTLLLAGGGGSRALAESPLARMAEPGAIRSLGQVPDDHLVLLYCGTDAFVFPSTHEGFGIPVMEARACGTKVVASDIPELHEAGSDDAIYVTPTAEGIRNGIIRAVGQQKTQPGPKPYANAWGESGVRLAKLLTDGRGPIETSCR